MLTEMDDTLFHQIPTTFDHAGTSDYRFFDRHWFDLFALNGEIMVVTTMGLYKNMNVLDGAGCAIVSDEGRQHNVRVSRQFRPNVNFMGAGPLRCDILEPLKRHRIVLEENEYDLSFDMEFEAMAPPHEEGHHYRRQHGRVIEEQHRFGQVGKASGFVRVGNRTFYADPETWGAVRDHSWGVRPMVGGVDLITAEEPGGGWWATWSGLFMWLCYSVGDVSGYLQIWENSDGSRARLDSSLFRLSGEEQRESKLREVDHALQFYPGTRQLKSGELVLTDEEGQRHDLVVTRVRDPFAYAAQGYGYGGYKDGKGLGAYRGKLLVEGDTWDVSEPEIVRDERGNDLGRVGREGPVLVKQGGHVGYGHIALFMTGAYPRYGFD